jgi:hypothetical protein
MMTEPIPSAAPASPAPSAPVALASHATEVTPAPGPHKRLAELELALSREVTQDMGQWNLAQLRQQVVELQGTLSDSTSTRAAQQLLERVDEFARLQQRHQQLAGALPAESPHPFVTPAPPVIPSTPQSQSVPKSHYAGQGWLVPVISSLPNLPRFALTDRQGTIRAFVSARPGLNLRRYERREVGIVGRETRSTDDQAPHLLADRVVVLDRHRR